MTTPDISVTLHKKRATIIGESELGKFWLNSHYARIIVKTDTLTALQLEKTEAVQEIQEMRDDGLEVSVR